MANHIEDQFKRFKQYSGIPPPKTPEEEIRGFRVPKHIELSIPRLIPDKDRVKPLPMTHPHSPHYGRDDTELDPQLEEWLRARANGGDRDETRVPCPRIKHPAPVVRDMPLTNPQTTSTQRRSIFG